MMEPITIDVYADTVCPWCYISVKRLDRALEQAQAVRQALGRFNRPAGTTGVAQAFTGARKDRVGEILETLAGLGQLMKLEDGRYAR